ncbi:MAG: hypothetical protein M1828_001622 [Chrysothrix sp. TS-e1954]|nr:MAG: hypothetical protein M1828_001622 [Chrysothrix sp. TS-e1954]
MAFFKILGFLAVAASTTSVLAAPAPVHSFVYKAPSAESEGPETFTSHAYAPDTPIHLLPFQASENVILLGGNASAELCPPPPSHCPEQPVNPKIHTVFDVFGNGTGRMNSTNPQHPQTLYVTEDGQLAYLPANVTSSVPSDAYNETFTTFTSPPRGLNATANRTWRFTGGGASAFRACKGSDFETWEVWADTDGFDGSLFQKPCVQFVAVAVGFEGKSVWQYD